MSQDSCGQERQSDLISPFSRLAALLEGIEPEMEPIDMAPGGPRHPFPDFVMEKIAEASPSFGRYPGIQGSPEFLQAVASWLERRYPGVRGTLGTGHVTSLCGTREGLFSAVFPAVGRRADLERPAALIPNPFYHTYAGGAVAAGAEPVYLAAGPESGFLPELHRIEPGHLDRTAVMFLCSPSNPQGAVADRRMLSHALELARRHDFMLFADECYSEIYTREPPPGVLEVAAETADGFRNVVAFHSLSKRSNLPGLRAGFCAGDADFIAALAQFRNVIGPQMPLPLQHAAAAVWADERHVEENRARYRETFAIADELLTGKFGYQRPAGGFFLWLNVASAGGGEAVVKTLWKDCGVRLLPGAYLSRTDASGSNPGADFVRVAMVADAAETREALTRIATRLG